MKTSEFIKQIEAIRDKIGGDPEIVISDHVVIVDNDIFDDYEFYIKMETIIGYDDDGGIIEAPPYIIIKLKY